METEKPTEILSEEHKYILKIANALTKECNSLDSGKKLDKTFFETAIDFIKNYADKFHHAKEEDILFKEFDKCTEEGCVQCNPTQQMLYEHDLGRGFVKGMAEGLKANDKTKVAENARGYAQLIQEHIFKEDNILYPMAEQALNESMQKEILKKFEQAESKKFAKGMSEKYEGIADEFEKR